VCAAGAQQEQTLPKQNRPLVRDGRIQAKKRTDRTYLRTPAQPSAPAGKPEEPPDDLLGEPDEVAEVIQAEAQTMAPSRLPQAVRAMQQQGVRKRREVDLHALAVSDTEYALHELRRIAVLTAMVIATLIVLGVVLR
jgi:hypothetical protein